MTREEWKKKHNFRESNPQQTMRCDACDHYASFGNDHGECEWMVCDLGFAERLWGPEQFQVSDEEYKLLQELSSTGASCCCDKWEVYDPALGPGLSPRSVPGGPLTPILSEDYL